MAGDPVPAVEVVAAPSAPELNSIAVCLLDVEPEEQARRLLERGDPPELLGRHQAFAEWMRRQASDPLHMIHVVSDCGWAEVRWDRLKEISSDWHMYTIDAPPMTQTEVGDAVLSWVRRALIGGAPSLTVAAG